MTPHDTLTYIALVAILGGIVGVFWIMLTDDWRRKRRARK